MLAVGQNGGWSRAVVGGPAADGIGFDLVSLTHSACYPGQEQLPSHCTALPRYEHDPCMLSAYKSRCACAVHSHPAFFSFAFSSSLPSVSAAVHLSTHHRFSVYIPPNTHSHRPPSLPFAFMSLRALASASRPFLINSLKNNLQPQQPKVNTALLLLRPAKDKQGS